jgi:hypothetical protein
MKRNKTLKGNNQYNTYMAVKEEIIKASFDLFVEAISMDTLTKDLLKNYAEDFYYFFSQGYMYGYGRGQNKLGKYIYNNGYNQAIKDMEEKIKNGRQDGNS